ncbi:MAG: NAD(P)/FAD-dependent oxidoreductase [Halioglobus sp.]
MRTFGRRAFMQRTAVAGLAAASLSRPTHAQSGADYDVVIVGAGIAGLTAARLLGERGPDLKLLILDARDRVGGRIFTLGGDDAPTGVDVGAQFIHGSKADTWELIKEFELQTRPIDHFGEMQMHGFSRQKGGTVLTPEQRAAVLGSVRENYARHFGADIALAQFAEELKLSPAQMSAITYDANSWSAEPEAISLRAAVLDGEAWDTYRDNDFLIYGGYHRLIDQMTAELTGKIRLNSRVTGMLWGEELSAVFYENRGLESAVTTRCIINTLPIGVLQSGDVQFSPGLPDDKQAAIDGLTMGSVVVIPMAFNEPFWMDAVPNYGGWYSTDGRVYFGVPHPEEGTTPVVKGFFSGAAADQLSAEGPEQAIQTAIGWLEQASGISGLGGKLQWHHVQDWITDPYSRGSYSVTRPGGYGLRATLAQPLGKSLFFAGEATAPPPHYQTVHGAYMSGKRVAAEVARALVPPDASEATLLELI